MSERSQSEPPEEDIEESEWKFEVDEVGPDGVEREEPTIEPESIDIEHALFVVLGVLMGIGAILAAML